MNNERKSVFKDTLVVGFATFAVFFGAGNLVFPPQIGLVSGSKVIFAICGLVICGILLPMLALYSVGNMGNIVSDMTRHVHSKLHVALMALGVLGVCIGTIPRCGGVGYEVGFCGIFPNTPSYSKWIFLIVFFGLAYLLASGRSTVMDNIGKYVTPFLLISLLVIVALAVINPIGPPVGGVEEHAFTNAFLTAINTGDVPTGIICGGMFISALAAKGYKPGREQKMMLRNVIIVAFIILFVVYVGLCWIGSTGTKLFAPDTDTTVLLVGLIRHLAGNGGIVVLSIAVILATFTTACGMIATASDWVLRLTNEKAPYKLTALIITVIILLVASTGVTFVIKLAQPLFTLMFPLYVTMTVLGICKKLMNDGAWKGACLMAIIVGFISAFHVAMSNGLLPSVSFIHSIYTAIPLSAQGLPWALPALIGGIVGGVIWKSMKKDSLIDEVDVLIAQQNGELQS